jgi:hypothetical protein
MRPYSNQRGLADVGQFIVLGTQAALNLVGFQRLDD